MGQVVAGLLEAKLAEKNKVQTLDRGYFSALKVEVECGSGEDKGISQTAQVVYLSLQ